MIEKDLHGMTKKEVYNFLLNLNEKDIKVIKLITGVGRHSHNKPQMDYYCEREWKCPIKEVILDYIINEKKEGARITVFPSYIIWRPRK